MKANSDKSHLIMSCKEAITAMMYGFYIKSSKTKVLPGIITNHELKFVKYVNFLCKETA